MAKKTSRIQMENRDRILEAALDIFSRDGYRGASIEEIARSAGMSKPNLFYYYENKDAIYQALLNYILKNWAEPLERINADGDPRSEIISYIRRKVEIAKNHPRESRLFASEIMRGAEHFKDVLAGEHKKLVDEKAKIIRKWMRDGALIKTDPHHLIFSIWAMTQHYADFDTQVRILLGPNKGSEGRFEDAARTIETLLLKGLLPRD